MAKKKAAKEEVVDKDELAKKKAEDLFNDVLGETKGQKEEKSTPAPKATKAEKSGNAWLEDQVQTLSERVEQLEDELAQKTLDYQKLLSKKGGDSSSMSDSEIQKSIKEIFEDLRKNYEGLNDTRTRYTDASIRVLLEKFLKKFPFLTKGKQQVLR